MSEFTPDQAHLIHRGQEGAGLDWKEVMDLADLTQTLADKVAELESAPASERAAREAAEARNAELLAEIEDYKSEIEQEQIAYREQLGVIEYWQDGANAASDECMAIAAQRDKLLVALEDAPHAAQDGGCNYEATKYAEEPLQCTCWKSRVDLSALARHDEEVKATALEEFASWMDSHGGRSVGPILTRARAAEIRKEATE